MTILEILEAHTVKRPWSEASRMRCKCGEVVTAETVPQLYTLHRAHVAEVLEQNMQSVVSETQEHAWDEGYGDCWDFHRSAGMIGRETNPYLKESSDGR